MNIRYAVSPAISLQEHLAIIEEHRLRNIFWPLLLCGIAFGISLQFMEPALRLPGLMDRVSVEYTATFDYLKPLIKQVKEEKERQEKAGGTSRPAGETGTSVRNGRTKARTASVNGDPREKNGMALISLITGKSSDIPEMFGVETALKEASNLLEDVDAVLHKTPGLKFTGPSRRGRQGMPTSIFTSGMAGGDGPGALDDMIAGLDGGAPGAYSLTRRSQLTTIRTSVPVAESMNGDRDANEIRALVNDRVGGIKYAYNTILKTHPGLQGKIVVVFTIAPSGKVIRARVSVSTMNCPELDAKILRAVRSWRFRKADCGNTTVTYPFVFSPGM